MLAGDRVSGTDADRHEDISHNGSSGFGDNADSATADLSPCPINAQIAAPLFTGSHIGCPKNESRFQKMQVETISHLKNAS